MIKIIKTETRVDDVPQKATYRLNLYGDNSALVPLEYIRELSLDDLKDLRNQLNDRKDLKLE